MASSEDGSQVLPSQVPVASWSQVLVTSAFGSYAMILKGGDGLRVERLVIGGDVVDDGDQTCPALAFVALGLIDVADATGATLLHMACQRGLEVRSNYDLCLPQMVISASEVPSLMTSDCLRGAFADGN